MIGTSVFTQFIQKQFGTATSTVSRKEALGLLRALVRLVLDLLDFHPFSSMPSMHGEPDSLAAGVFLFHTNLQQLDDQREDHCEVDVALVEVLAETLGYQQHADEDEERECEDL